MPSDLVLGPAGERLRQNVKELRGRNTYVELSAQLADQGRPIPELGLSRLERGARRVDADDLVALAVVLGVTPNRLLLEREAGDEPVPLTPATTVPARHAWEWACGERNLGPRLNLDFHRENRPHDRQGDYPIGMVRKYRAELEPVRRAAQDAQDAGVPRGLIVQFLQLTTLGWEMEKEHDAGPES